MKIVFRTNLGLADAKKCGLEHTKCLVGNTADVPNDVGELFIKRGVAVAADKAAKDDVIQSALEERHKQESAKEVKGVAKSPEVTAPSPESFGDNPHDQTKKRS